MKKSEKVIRLLADLKVKTDEINGMTEDGRFFKLPFLQRYAMVRSINSSYRKLLQPALSNELKLLLPAATVLIAAGCSVPAGTLTGSGSGGGTGNDSFKAPVSAAFGMITPATDYLTFPYLNDHDNDGDLDLVSVTYTSLAGGIPEVVYYENTGTPSSPNFAAAADATTNFLKIPSADDLINGDFADIDNDGDLDLVTTNTNNSTGTEIIKLVYFENLTDPTGPTGLAASFTELQTINDGYFISVADMDGDGDLDVIQMPYVYSATAASGYKSVLNFFENTGTPTAPVFNTPGVTGAFNLEIPVVSAVGYPVFTRPVDFDNDGDLDLFIGIYTEQTANTGVFYAENTGTATAPDFPSAVLNPFDITPAANSMNKVALGDLDNDGDIDLLTGDYYSGTVGDPSFAEAEFYYYENQRK